MLSSSKSNKFKITWKSPSRQYTQRHGPEGRIDEGGNWIYVHGIFDGFTLFSHLWVETDTDDSICRTAHCFAGCYHLKLHFENYYERLEVYSLFFDELRIIWVWTKMIFNNIPLITLFEKLEQKSYLRFTILIIDKLKKKFSNLIREESGCFNFL